MPTATFHEVSTFTDLSNAITTNAEINVVGNIEFSQTITIAAKTNVKIYSEVGAVFTSSFTADSRGGMFYIQSGSDVTFTGVGFLSGSATSAGGCVYVTQSNIEVQDSEDRHRRGESPVGESRARSPSLLSRQKSIGEFVREAAAFSTARDSARDSESSTTRHRMDPTSEPPPGHKRL